MRGAAQAEVGRDEAKTQRMRGGHDKAVGRVARHGIVVAPRERGDFRRDRLDAQLAQGEDVVQPPRKR